MESFPRQGMKAMPLLLFSVYTIAVFAQPDTGRADCNCVVFEENHWQSATSISLEMYLNQCVGDGVDSLAYARASELFVDEADYSGGNCNPYQCSDFVLESDVDSDSEIAYAAIWWPDSDCLIAGWNGVAAFALANPGYVYAGAGSELVSVRHESNYYGASCCFATLEWRSTRIGDSTALAYSEFEIVPECSGATLVTNLVINRGRYGYTADCNGPDAFGASSSYLVTTFVRFIGARVVWTMESGPPQATIMHGLVVDSFDSMSGESVSFLGSFLGEDPESNCTDGCILYYSPEVPEGAIAGSVQMISDSFEGHNGDINGDGQVCDDDRELMDDLVALNPSIDEEGYNPRADFDLDGVIDSCDETAFYTIYNLLPDTNNNQIPDDCE